MQVQESCYPCEFTGIYRDVMSFSLCNTDHLDAIFGKLLHIMIPHEILNVY